MANLIRLTVTEDNKLTSKGSYSFNTALIKKVYTFGTGSLIYYVDGTNKQSKITKIKISESAATVNVSLVGSLDFAIVVNSILSNGTIRSETIKTSDIIYGRISPSDLNKTILKISDIDQHVITLNLNNTLLDIETLSNKGIVPSTGLTFNPATAIKFDKSYQFNNYPIEVNFTINVDFTEAVPLNFVDLTLTGNGTIFTITFNSMIKMDGSGDLSFTLNKKNKVRIYYDGTTVWYYIYAIGAAANVAFSAVTGIPNDNVALANALVVRPVTTIGDNIFDYNSVGILRGKYLDSSSVEITYATTSISDYIPVIVGTSYICNKYFAASTRNVWYNSNKTVISNFSTAGGTAPTGATYVRFSLNLNNTNDITLANIKVEEGTVSSEYTPFERRMQESNLPATVLTSSSLKHSVNLFNYLTAISSKYLNYTTGQLSDNAGFFASDFIPCLPSTDYVTKNSYHRCFYNSKKQFISGVQSTASDVIMNSPVNAFFFRFSDVVANFYTGQVAQASTAIVYQPYKTYLQNFYDVSHKWTGKKWAAIGTSISNNTLYTQNVTGYLELVFTNCGVSGSRMATNLTDAMWQDARVNAVPSDVNIVTIEAGTNDWANNVALGTITSSNTDEFYGAYNTLITKLLTRNPLYRIIIITTPWGRVAGFSGNGNKNASNLGPEDYAQACRDIAKRWGLPIVDLQQNGGWNSLNYTSYLSDDLHPNILGGRRFSDIVIGKMIELSPKFEGL